MTKGTIAVLVVSDKVLSENGDFNSCLSSLATTEWQALKFCVLPPNQQIIQHEVTSVHKMCDVVVIIAEEKGNCSANVCKVISDIFYENSVSNSTLLNGDENVVLYRRPLNC